MKQPRSGQPAQLGIYVLWLGTRIAQFLFLEIVIKQIYDAKTHVSPAASIEIVSLFVLFSVMVHPISIGWLDAEGIRYRKYVGIRNARWESIESIQWTGPQVKISLRGKGYFNGRLKCWMNPVDAVTNYGLQQKGDEPTPPAVLERIAALPLEHPPELLLGPLVSPGFSNAMIAGFGSATCIAVVGLVWRIFEIVSRQ